MKGVIALDIDGTLTTGHGQVPCEVVERLASYADEGWAIVLITGRPAHGLKLLDGLPFPLHVAPQNGAYLIALPTKQVVHKRCLQSDILPVLEEICISEPSDFVVYSGFDHHDRVYYRPAQFSTTLQAFIKDRCRAFGEQWIEIDAFDALPVQEFSSVKSFGDHQLAQRIAERVEAQLGLHIPVIRDPYDSNYCVIQGTHPEVNKGNALRDFVAHLKAEGLPTIAAGDDYNDLPLLREAQLSIAMGSAPSELKEIADTIAPTAEDLGILVGLSDAMSRLEQADA